MSTTETGNSSAESEVTGDLAYDETELTLGLPGGGTAPNKHPETTTTDRKRGFLDSVGLNLSTGEDCGVHSSDSSDGPVSSAKPPAAKAQAVGWPPVRSFRRNVLKSCNYVKVAVDGAPYLRKVDLEAHGGYQQLLDALEEMFSASFTARNYSNERRLVDPVNGTEYVPTYEDKDGDWMLVGDVPWKMFVASCKRLRLMKSTEAVNLAPRMTPGCTSKQ